MSLLLIISLYFFALIILASFLKKSKSYEDFTITKKGLSVVSIATGLVMTHYGAGFLLGGAELGYRYGLYGLIYGISAAIGILFLGFFFPKKIIKECKNKKIKTLPSLLHKKFKSKKIAILSAGLSIVCLTGIASAQIFAATKIFLALNISITLSCLIITTIIILVASKGMSALTKFGKYNLIIASIGGLVAVILASTISPAIHKSPFEDISLSSLLAIFIPTVMYTLIGQDFHQKIYSTKRYGDIKKACIISFIILLLLGIFPVIIGIKSKWLFTINPTEALPNFMLLTLPILFRGLFLAAILAAVIGSAQSVINAASTQISEDIFKQIKKFSEKKLRKIAIISTVFISIFALVIALVSKSIIDNMIIAYSLYTAGMFIPVAIAFFSKNPKKFTKIILTLSISGIFFSFLFEFIIPTRIPSIVFGVIISGILFLTYLLSTKWLKSI